MAKEMPKKQAVAFEKCMMAFINALANAEKTSQRAGLIGAYDQIKTYEAEYNATVKIDVENRRLYQIPN